MPRAASSCTWRLGIKVKATYSTWTGSGGARTRKLACPQFHLHAAPGRGCVTLPATVYKTLVLPRILAGSRRPPRAPEHVSRSRWTSTPRGAAHRRPIPPFRQFQHGRRSCRVNGGNGKRERGTWSIIRLCPKTTLMSLYDRAADKQPDAHASALRGVEGIEH